MNSLLLSQTVTVVEEWDESSLYLGDSFWWRLCPDSTTPQPSTESATLSTGGIATLRHAAVQLAGWAAWGSNGVSVPASAPHVISDTISGSRVLIFYIFAQQIVTGLCCQVFDWCWQSATTWYGPASITCWRHAVSWSLRRNAGQLVPLHPFPIPTPSPPGFLLLLTWSPRQLHNYGTCDLLPMSLRDVWRSLDLAPQGWR